MKNFISLHMQAEGAKELYGEPLPGTEIHINAARVEFFHKDGIFTKVKLMGHEKVLNVTESVTDVLLKLKDAGQVF